MVKRKNKIMDENVKSSDVKVDNLDKITLPKRKSYKVLIVSAFLQKLRDNKLYLFSFVVTVIPRNVDSEGMPIGMQLIGNRFQEETILNAAYTFEQKIKFRENHKPIVK